MGAQGFPGLCRPKCETSHGDFKGQVVELYYLWFYIFIFYMFSRGDEKNMPQKILIHESFCLTQPMANRLTFWGFHIE